MENPKYKLAMWPAVIHAKCPRCRQGDMFDGPAYSFKSQVMHTNCPHCGLLYEREPGYFYVAMLISYAMFVAEMVTLAVAIHVLTGSNNPWLYVGIIMGSGILLSPFNFRYSRVSLLYWLTPGLHYNESYSAANNDKKE